ncbi:anti-anti-sigma factor [Amycolatopsis bartoniae]|uniref:Anti-sigma factor antagonist n=1 Tax=Amycolatopsis bartoniae TaxID=941986 RepID=A0A8H9IVA9_9PSEU|nr:anti-sigma factor antagonist [Amycolatopsis bartoniae]MBB2939029.1 anti-anti-sigma factor [Amycolatopsis bartoniae]GHF65492.1 hypothetical protein GCM10017566_43780 [Amycolatopsis bartoniae]
MNLDVAWERQRDRVRVTVTGEVDAATAPRLRDALVAARTGTGLKSLVVDLSGVGFLDSCGLTVLAEAHEACEAAGQRLEVVCATDAVRRPLFVTGLDDVLTVVDRTPVAAS